MKRKAKRSDRHYIPSFPFANLLDPQAQRNIYLMRNALPCNILEFCLMFLCKKSRSSNNQKFGLAALAASSAALLALATPAAANPLTFSQKIIAPDGASGDYFGLSVALDGNYALIGSYLDDDNGTNSGSAYLFDTTTGNFLQKLTAPDGANSDNFGRSVALNGNYALIGSRFDDDNGTNSGSAYLFALETEKVPEPSAVLGLFVIGILAAFKGSSRQQKQ